MVNLEKGGKVLLEKTNESGTPLTKIKVGCGWDAKASGASGSDFDLDASIIAIKADGKALAHPHGLCFYGQLKTLGGVISHSGDNLTGDGDGDDEVITIDLANVPAEVDKMIVVVNIYQAGQRGQNFGMAENSYCRLLNASDNDTELVHFDLNFDSSTSTGVKFATIFRKGPEWAFSADQVEFEGGLEKMKQEYSIA